MTRIAIIARDAINSPNMSESDAAILECIAGELATMGVETIKGTTADENIDAICHMSRNGMTLEKIAALEKKGTRAFNRASAVKMCSREAFTYALHGKGIPQARFCILKKKEELETLAYPAWIKNGSGWSIERNDVCHAANAEEAAEAFFAMRKRGVSSIMYFEHIEGDIIKFYGVGGDYFRYCYPDPEKSKFGLEKMNGTPRHYPFDAERLKEIAVRAARTVGLDIYGGDCIVTADGEIFIIDLNDFPSFSAIRAEVAKEIAAYITRTVKEESST